MQENAAHRVGKIKYKKGNEALLSLEIQCCHLLDVPQCRTAVVLVRLPNSAVLATMAFSFLFNHLFQLKCNAFHFMMMP